MFTVFEQVFLLFVFAIAGYILAKTGIVKTEHAGILSKLLVYFFLPCNIIKTFTENFTIPYITTHVSLLVTSVVVLIATILLSEIVVRLIEREPYRRAVYRYSLIIPNLGYMGWPLIGALYGDEMMLSSMIYCLPMQIYIYTYGFASLTKTGMNPKSLINPSIISFAIGIFLGLTGIELPEILISTMDRGSSCMGPLSMILAGIVISEYKPLDIVRDVRPWIVTVFRLLLLPAAVALIARPFVSREVLIIAVSLAALPCGLNTIVFPKLVEEDCKPGAALGLVSNILACATIPLCLTFLL